MKRKNKKPALRGQTRVIQNVEVVHHDQPIDTRVDQEDDSDVLLGVAAAEIISDVFDSGSGSGGGSDSGFSGDGGSFGGGGDTGSW